MNTKINSIENFANLWKTITKVRGEGNGFYPMLKLDLFDPEGVAWDNYPYEEGSYFSAVNAIVKNDEWRYYVLNVDIKEDKKGFYRGYLDEDGAIALYDDSTSLMKVITPVKYPCRSFEFDVPKETKLLFLSYKKHPRALPFNFAVGAFCPMDVTDRCMNWADVAVTQSRRSTDGVIFDWQDLNLTFCLEAGKAIEDLFKEKGIYARACLNIFRRHSIHNVYILRKTLELDFENYNGRFRSHKVSISGINNLLQKIIQSKGSTSYDLEVSALKSEKPWEFDRLNIFSAANFTMSTTDEYTFNQIPISFNLSLASEEVVPDFTVHKAASQDYGWIFAGATPSDNFSQYFFKAVEYLDKLNIDIDLTIRASEPSTIHIWEYKKDKSLESKASWNITSVLRINETAEITDIEEGSMLVFGVESGNEATYKLERFVEFRTRYDAKGKPLHIDVIDPSRLLQALIDKMAGEGEYTAAIEWDEDFSFMLAAAESVRNFPKAVIHTSYNDFEKWMYCMGYERSLYTGGMVFAKRDTFFRRDVTALELKPRETADHYLKSDTEHVCTRIKAGYDIPSYEQTAGKLEVNGQFDYTTGYLSKEKDRELDLVSPYRGDSIGIEILCWDRLTDITDTSSDNDIFVIALKEGQESYLSYRDVEVESFGVYLLNGVISPPMIIRRNESLIGISTRQVEFAGTEAYRYATSSKVDIYGDIPIEKQLFKPMVYDFATSGRAALPDEDIMNGVVSFTIDEGFKEVTYLGFIKDITKNYGRNSEATFVLYVI